MAKRLARAGMIMLCLIAVGCATMSRTPPKVSLVDLQVSDVRMFETGLIMTVRYQNFDDKPLLISGASHELSLNGTYVGLGSSPEAVEVPAFGTATDVVQLHLSNLALAGTVQQLFRSANLSYAIDSKVRIGGSSFGQTVSAKSEGTVTLPQPPAGSW